VLLVFKCRLADVSSAGGVVAARLASGIDGV